MKRLHFLTLTLLLMLTALSAQAEEEALLFNGEQVPPPNDRLHVQEQGKVRVVSAVPSREETQEEFGFDLYKKDIQPVWIQVENRYDQTLVLTPLGLDPDYLTARETAHRNRGNKVQMISGEFERRSRAHWVIPPKSIQSAYIFSRLDEGTKSFNIDMFGDSMLKSMSFFVPVPGLKLDHHRVDREALYDDSEMRDLTLEELVAELEAMPCCVRDAKGEDKGDPLKLVFVGEVHDLYYSFMRAGWDETEITYGASAIKTGISAILGGRYRYSPISALYVFGRAQDVALQRARQSIHERNHLRVWLTPLRLEGKPVWIGQISRDIGVRFTRRTITTHKIDPDVDETREFLLEDLAYTQSVVKFGYIGGVGPASYEEPRGNLTGDPYFTDGRRIIMWLSGEPTPLDEVQRLELSPYYTGVVGD